jgi:hypothetical protein
VFDDAARSQYIESLHSVMLPGARHLVIGFSEDFGFTEPARPSIARLAIRASFDQGWRMESLVRRVMEWTIDANGAGVWLARVVRVAA